VTIEILVVNSPLSHRKKSATGQSCAPYFADAGGKSLPKPGLTESKQIIAVASSRSRTVSIVQFGEGQTFLRNANMHDPNDFEVIFRMTITRGGRKIRRSDGKPWKIVLRK
jgi:hypothetical protein